MGVKVLVKARNGFRERLITPGKESLRLDEGRILLSSYPRSGTRT